MTTVYVVKSHVEILPAEYNDNDYTSNWYGGNTIGVYATRELADQVVARGGLNKNVVAGYTAYDFLGGEYNETELFNKEFSSEDILRRMVDVFGYERVGLGWSVKYRMETKAKEKGMDLAQALEDIYKNSEDYINEVRFPGDMTDDEWNRISELIVLRLSLYVEEHELVEA